MAIIYVFLVIVCAALTYLMKPIIISAFQFRGPFEHEYDEFDRIIKDYSTAIDQEMGSDMALFFKGSAYLMAGQKRKARADFLKARKMGKRVPQRTLDLCR